MCSNTLQAGRLGRQTILAPSGLLTTFVRNWGRVRCCRCMPLKVVKKLNRKINYYGQYGEQTKPSTQKHFLSFLVLLNTSIKTKPESFYLLHRLKAFLKQTSLSYWSWILYSHINVVPNLELLRFQCNAISGSLSACNCSSQLFEQEARLSWIGEDRCKIECCSLFPGIWIHFLYQCHEFLKCRIFPLEKNISSKTKLVKTIGLLTCFTLHKVMNYKST